MMAVLEETGLASHASPHIKHACVHGKTKDAEDNAILPPMCVKALFISYVLLQKSARAASYASDTGSAQAPSRDYDVH